MSRGCTQLFWQLSDRAFFKGRHHFFVDWGRDGTDDWTALNEEPIVDDCFVQDCCQRHWADLITHSYRVRLLLPDEPGCPVLVSQPTSAHGNLERRDWLQLRDLVRKEHLQQRKQGGTGEGVPGFLLKRKHFGQGCPDCLDWSTREVTDSDCGTCYGVGIVGGYYPGIEYWMTPQGQWERNLNSGDQGPRGLSSDIAERNRAILYPRIDTKDIWVNARNDQRYVIRKWQVAAQFKGIPFVAWAELRLAHATDTVYNVPVEGTLLSSESSQEAGTEPCDVTKGLDDSYETWG
jgi:hypothetical protein